MKGRSFRSLLWPWLVTGLFVTLVSLVHCQDAELPDLDAVLIDSSNEHHNSSCGLTVVLLGASGDLAKRKL
ncbi:MAG: hypothetical protein Q8P67_04425 [archaeon]|nr:hypothetical protein [archaeon]